MYVSTILYEYNYSAMHIYIYIYMTMYHHIHNYNTMHVITTFYMHMSRALASCSGRLANLKIARSSPEPVALKPGRVKPIQFKIDACHFLAWRSALLR